ncbi:septal ring lytic transglycosylase RlpA family protein [bacterium]|nr:septal ring lytic transglycosylase RlpA family protein [bacterium]
MKNIAIIFFTFAIIFTINCSSVPRYTNKQLIKDQDNETTDVSNAFRIQEGTASYYADKFHGRKTSNGETYNMFDLTAAHRTLPFDTKIRVINLENGRSVVVRINDRGPFVKNRIIDLSLKAAKELGMIKNGTAKVRLEIISE